MADLFPETIPESTGNRDSWATPRDVFEALNAEFGFTLDPCAEPWSAKCERFYTRRDDGLSRSWIGERVFLNPPYSDPLPWMSKAAVGGARLVVALVPPSTDTRWWHDWVEHYADEVRFPKGRIQFIPPPGIKPSTNDSPSCIVVYRNPVPVWIERRSWK